MIERGNYGPVRCIKRNDELYDRLGIYDDDEGGLAIVLFDPPPMMYYTVPRSWIEPTDKMSEVWQAFAVKHPLVVHQMGYVLRRET